MLYRTLQPEPGLGLQPSASRGTEPAL